MTYLKMETNLFIKCRLESSFQNPYRLYLKLFPFSYFIESNRLCRRNISEGGRPSSDILQITSFLKLRKLLGAVNIQKAFDSVNHLFINPIKKFVFGKIFSQVIQILLRNNESCTINKGNTTKYFKLEKGARQGTKFLLIYLFLFLKQLSFTVKKIKIFRALIILTMYSNILLMPTIQHFL